MEHSSHKNFMKQKYISNDKLLTGIFMKYLNAVGSYNDNGPLYLSSGRAVGLRLIPMIRDLRFFWEEMPQQLLDEQAHSLGS